MGGRIEIESAPGEGTRVRVYLPVASAPVAQDPRKLERRALPAPRRGRILVVDDEEMIGAVARRALGVDHEVVVETAGRAAIGRVLAGEHFDVVLCDLMMPETSGMDVHGAFMQMHPGLAANIVFMSGGAFTPEAREFLAEVPNERIEKPFDLVDLRNVVNARL